MNNLNHIKQEIKDIITSLEKANHLDLSNALQKHLINLDNPKTFSSALTEIIGLCHVKGMGDLYMKEYQGYSWPNKISALKIKCQKEIKKQD